MMSAQRSRRKACLAAKANLAAMAYISDFTEGDEDNRQVRKRNRVDDTDRKPNRQFHRRHGDNETVVAGSQKRNRMNDKKKSNAHPRNSRVLPTRERFREKCTVAPPNSTEMTTKPHTTNQSVAVGKRASSLTDGNFSANDVVYDIKESVAGTPTGQRFFDTAKAHHSQSITAKTSNARAQIEEGFVSTNDDTVVFENKESIAKTHESTLCNGNTTNAAVEGIVSTTDVADDDALFDNKPSMAKTQGSTLCLVSERHHHSDRGPMMWHEKATTLSSGVDRHSPWQPKSPKATTRDDGRVHRSPQMGKKTEATARDDGGANGSPRKGKKIEATTSDVSPGQGETIEPTDVDVLFKRGSILESAEGSQKFLSVMNELVIEQPLGYRETRNEIIDQYLSRYPSARFLRENKGQWACYKRKSVAKLVEKLMNKALAQQKATEEQERKQTSNVLAERKQVGPLHEKENLFVGMIATTADNKCIRRISADEIPDVMPVLNHSSPTETTSPWLPESFSRFRLETDERVIPDIGRFSLDQAYPRTTFVEDLAWKFFNESDTDSSMLCPLPPPPNVPEPPSTGKCVWSYDKQSRVMLANFRAAGKPAEVSEEDKKFLLEVMERDDVTVVTEGLAEALDPQLWDLSYLQNAVGGEFYHRFRKFKQKVVSRGGVSTMTYREVDGCVSMRVSDYLEYLRRRISVCSEDDESKTTFHFYTEKDVEQTVDVRSDVLYMIDYDMERLLPALHADFVKTFLLPECLPGGSLCMMNCVTKHGRPEMGPNLYVTPPGSFTHFHQDGHGTVDSGHMCLSGYNEVVILRRLPLARKKHAIQLLTHGSSSLFDPLNDLPHNDKLGDRPPWPTESAIKECDDMNYCPSVFVLKPGQHVHINKGRIHAFRKLSPDQLPMSDCHAKLRQATTELPNFASEGALCISVAWDWMFRGSSSQGTNREVVSILECAALNRQEKKQSLAIPELCVLQMAKTMTSERFFSTQQTTNQFPMFRNSRMAAVREDFRAVLRGLLPSLRFLVKQQVLVTQAVKQQVLATQAVKRRASSKLSVAKRPNSWENPTTFLVDPYGVSDFFCKLCHVELSNVYMHCDGCEELLSCDFNICVKCHSQGAYRANIQMNPLNSRRCSIVNHVGDSERDRGKSCPCKMPICKRCRLCSTCSCKCHQEFTLHHRLLNATGLENVVKRVESIVGDDPIEFHDEVEERLCSAHGSSPQEYFRNSFPGETSGVES